jgi:hypothetical protein
MNCKINTAFRLKQAGFLLILSFIAFSASGRQLHTYVDKDSIQVGERFSYTIVFDRNSATDVQYPGEDNFSDPVTFLSRDRYSVDERRDSLVYQLQFFGTEDFTIPRKEVRVNIAGSDTTYYTAPVPLFFKSVLASEDEEFRPFKPIFEFARTWWPWVVALILLLVTGYYAYNWYKKREPKTVSVPAADPDPFVSPLVELRETIKRLPNTSELLQFKEFESYYVDLGDAIRRYLKRVYSIQALEMTTREIDQALKAELAAEEQIQITRKVLNEADMVKFANFKPTAEMAESVLQNAKRFIEVARTVNQDQIHYMKYRYEVDHGIIKESEIKEAKEVK